MSFFQVTPRELRNKAGKLSELNSRFKAKQQELTEQESALCSMWEGGARDTFHQAFTRGEKQRNRLRKKLLKVMKKKCKGSRIVRLQRKDGKLWKVF